MKRLLVKRIGRIFLCALIALTLLCPLALAARTMYTTDLINHRAKPSSSSALLQTIPRGAAVTFLDDGSHGYDKVSYNGKTGYALASYLVDSAAGDDEYADGDFLCNTADVNFRAEPASSARLICLIPDNSSLTYRGPGKNGYFYVEYNGQKGYVLSSYLVYSDSTSDACGWDEGAASLGYAKWKKSGSGMKIRFKVTNDSGSRTIKAFEIRCYPTDVWNDSMLPTDYSYCHTTKETIKPGKTEWSDYMGLDERKGVDRIYAYISRILYTDGTEEIPDREEGYWTITW